MPAVPGLACAWHWQPCDQLAGDTVGLARAADGRVGFHLIDVAGHGVRSALLAVQISRMLQQELESGSRRAPTTVLGGLNRAFPFNAATLQYFTMLLGELDAQTWEATIGHAAHPGPLLIADGVISDCSRRSAPVGIYPDEAATFAESKVTIPPGGILLLFSDGVTEAMDADHECFTEARLRAAIAAAPRDAAGLVAALVAALAAWRGAEAVSDDISLLALQRLA
jgi:sigma-B regulation protein RsbU (phosphoserine phosphatase)